MKKRIIMLTILGLILFLNIGEVRGIYVSAETCDTTKYNRCLFSKGCYDGYSCDSGLALYREEYGGVKGYDAYYLYGGLFCIEDDTPVKNGMSCSATYINPTTSCKIGYVINQLYYYGPYDYLEIQKAIHKIVGQYSGYAAAYNDNKSEIDNACANPGSPYRIGNRNYYFQAEAYDCGSYQDVVQDTTTWDSIVDSEDSESEQPEEPEIPDETYSSSCLSGYHNNKLDGNCIYSYTLTNSLGINEDFSGFTTKSGKLISKGEADGTFATLSITGTCTNIGSELYPNINDSDYSMILNRDGTKNIDVSTSVIEINNLGCQPKNKTIVYYDCGNDVFYAYPISGRSCVEAGTISVSAHACTSSATIKYKFASPIYASNGSGILTNTTQNSRYLGYGVVSDLNEFVSNGAINFEIANTELNGSCPYSVQKEVLDNVNKLNMEFRVIDVKQPFAKRNATSNTDNRDTKSNWCYNEDCDAENDTVETYITNANDSYNSKNAGYLYKIKLTPDDIKTIRTYNSTHKYDDYNFTCDNGTCTSDFLTDLKEGKIGDVTTSRLYIQLEESLED